MDDNTTPPNESTESRKRSREWIFSSEGGNIHLWGPSGSGKSWLINSLSRGLAKFFPSACEDWKYELSNKEEGDTKNE